MRLDAHQCSTRNWISFSDTDMGKQLQPSGCQVYTVQTLSLIRQDMEKNCNRPDVRATPSRRQSLLWKLLAAEVQLSGRGPDMVLREARYGKLVAQLSVRTLSATFLTPPREICSRINLGLLSL
jgi:hypothetical protein